MFKFSLFFLIMLIFSGCTSYKANYVVIKNEKIDNNSTKTIYNNMTVQCPSNTKNECILFTFDYISKQANDSKYKYITFLNPYNQFAGFYTNEKVEKFYEDLINDVHFNNVW